jgi:hypothetical protein
MSALIPASDSAAAIAAAVTSLGVGAVYLFIAYRIADRQTSPATRMASLQFGLWWGGLGASVGLGGVEVALAVAGALPYASAMTLYLLTVLIDCVFLWGLTGFLTYVYTGRYHLLEVSALYAAFYVAYLYWFFAQAPTLVTFEAAQPVWHYGAAANVPLEFVLLVLLIGPELVGAILYLSLRLRTQDSAQRYRINLVGGGILLWFALDLVVPSATIPWLIARTLLQVVPGLMSLIAFYPPEWARRKYGVTSIDTPIVEGREALANS